MATTITMPKAKSKTKQVSNHNHVDADDVPFNNDNSPAFNTRSAKKQMLFNLRKNSPETQCNHQMISTPVDCSSMEEDHMNFHRLLQLFPYFPPIYLQRIYALCNKNFIRTIDNVLYVKRYCAYLQTKKIDSLASSISPIQNDLIDELPVVDAETIQSTFNLSENDILEQENGLNEDSPLDLSDLDWIETRCKTPELLTPKYASTPY